MEKIGKSQVAPSHIVSYSRYCPLTDEQASKRKETKEKRNEMTGERGVKGEVFRKERSK